MRLCGCVALAAVCALASVNAEAQCRPRTAAAAALERLQSVMASGRYVAYHPTSLQLVAGAWTHADAASMREDLRVLRPRFDGLITYSSSHGADRIADIAASLGYRAVIVGVWDVADAGEVDRALAAAQRNPNLVVGISLGNERVFAKESTFEGIARTIRGARDRAPTLAFTTTEPFHLFLESGSDPVLDASDFMLVNVHPVFESWFRDAPDSAGAQFVVNVVDLLAPRCSPVLVKETGVPTAPAELGFTPARQAGFYAALRARFPAERARAFAYFSAFDAPWRVDDASPVPGVHPEEAHWGLYDAQRRAKPAIHDIVPAPRR
jgi:exo-beta-1,3-glucanase (GH17 family)